MEKRPTRLIEFIVKYYSIQEDHRILTKLLSNGTVLSTSYLTGKGGGIFNFITHKLYEYGVDVYEYKLNESFWDSKLYDEVIVYFKEDILTEISCKNEAIVKYSYEVKELNELIEKL